MSNGAEKPIVLIPEYHKIELGEILEKTRLIENIRIQLGTFIGTVNLSALGVAFSQEKAGIVIIAAITLFIFILVDMQGRNTLKNLSERGIELENVYSPEPQKSILHRQYWTNKESNRFKKLSISGFWLPLAVILFEFGLGLYLWLTGWSIF